MTALDKVLALSRGEAIADDDLLDLTWTEAARKASVLSRMQHRGHTLDHYSEHGVNVNKGGTKVAHIEDQSDLRIKGHGGKFSQEKGKFVVRKDGELTEHSSLQGAIDHSTAAAKDAGPLSEESRKKARRAKASSGALTSSLAFRKGK